MAEFKHILHAHQIGGRKQKSAIDAAIILIDKIQHNWRKKKKVTSVLFIDVANAYNHVGIAQFVHICIILGFLITLIYWFISFLTDRIMKFAFNGEIGPLISVNNAIHNCEILSSITKEFC